jgi:hypothetical protein
MQRKINAVMIYNFFKKHKALASATLVFLTLFITTQPVSADIVTSFTNDMTAGLKAAGSSLLGLASFYVSYASGHLAAKAFELAGFALEVGMNLNASIINSPAVQQGWKMARNFANLGFVLAMIFIAYATMLRLQNYNLFQMLRRLLVIALLINFSLAISGVILNLSNTVTNLFIAKMGVVGGEASSLSLALENLAGVTEVQRALHAGGLTDVIEGVTTGAFDAGKDGLQTLGGIFFGAAFTVISAVVLALITAMIFIRYFWIVGLLIVAPLAWLSYAIKPVEKYFALWWDRMLKWSFYLPILMFFLYLTTITLTNVEFTGNPSSPSSIINSTSAVGAFVDATIGTTFANYAMIAVALAFLIMGLIIGENFSILGAATAMGALKVTGDWTLGKVKSGVVGAGVGLGRFFNPLNKQLGYLGGDKYKNMTVGAGAALLLNKVTGKSFEGVKSALERAGAPNKDLVEQAAKQYRGIATDERLLDMANSRLNEAESAAMLKVLAEKKLLKKLDKDRVLALSSRGATFGAGKEIEKIRPDLLQDKEKIDRMLGGMSGKALFETLDNESLENPMVAEALKDKHREYLAKGEGVSHATTVSYLKGIEALINEKMRKNREAGVSENEGVFNIPAVKYALNNNMTINRIIEMRDQKESDVPENLWNLIMINQSEVERQERERRQREGQRQTEPESNPPTTPPNPSEPGRVAPLDIS